MSFYTPADFAPDCSIGYLTRRVYQLGILALEPVFAAEGVTGIQWSAMMSIWFERGLTSSDLARDLGHDKGAMTRLVDTMEERGWIRRARCSEDRRILNLSLTEEGAAVARRCRDGVIERWNIWLKDWDRADVETLIALMQKLRTTLDGVTVEGRSS